MQKNILILTTIEIEKKTVNQLARTKKKSND